MRTVEERRACEYRDTMSMGKPVPPHCHYYCETRLCPDEMGGNEECEGVCVYGALSHPCDDAHNCPLVGAGEEGEG